MLIAGAKFDAQTRAHEKTLAQLHETHATETAQLHTQIEGLREEVRASEVQESSARATCNALQQTVCYLAIFSRLAIQIIVECFRVTSADRFI